jgi:parallel beta-helix repeat protein
VIVIIILFFSYELLEKKDEKTQIKGKTLFVGISNDSYFKTIQDAINASSDNDTIIVENGVYNELLTINKSINLVGNNNNHTIINYSSNNSLREITYTGSTIAIYVNSSNNIIKNIKITNVSEGIILGVNKNYNLLSQNQILNNSIAIQTWKSSHNTIENNFIFSNSDNGIFIHTFSHDNTIKNNHALNNFYGIMIKGSNNNIVYNNCFKENNYGALVCCGSNNNIIYNNIFLNNSISNGQQKEDLINYWYSDPDFRGNYWDDYTGIDGNNDGYGDSPYFIPGVGKQDIYPLTIPPEDIICNI